MHNSWRLMLHKKYCVFSPRGVRHAVAPWCPGILLPVSSACALVGPRHNPGSCNGASPGIWLVVSEGVWVLCSSPHLRRRRGAETGVGRAADRGSWWGEGHPKEGSHRHGRFHRSSHPDNLVQAGGGLEGATMVSGGHGRDTASSGTVVLNGLWDKYVELCETVLLWVREVWCSALAQNCGREVM